MCIIARNYAQEVDIVGGNEDSCKTIGTVDLFEKAKMLCLVEEHESICSYKKKRKSILINTYGE